MPPSTAVDDANNLGEGDSYLLQKRDPNSGSTDRKRLVTLVIASEYQEGWLESGYHIPQ